jgi:hypothetical protein
MARVKTTIGMPTTRPFEENIAVLLRVFALHQVFEAETGAWPHRAC